MIEKNIENPPAGTQIVSLEEEFVQRDEFARENKKGTLARNSFKRQKVPTFLLFRVNK